MAKVVIEIPYCGTQFLEESMEGESEKWSELHPKIAQVISQTISKYQEKLFTTYNRYWMRSFIETAVNIDPQWDWLYSGTMQGLSEYGDYMLLSFPSGVVPAGEKAEAFTQRISNELKAIHKECNGEDIALFRESAFTGFKDLFETVANEKDFNVVFPTI